MAARFSGPGLPYEGLAVMTPSGPRWTGEVVCVEELLFEPHLDLNEHVACNPNQEHDGAGENKKQAE